MDVDTHSTYRAGNRNPVGKADGHAVHLLPLDGTMATIRKKSSDGTFELIVEVGDRRSEREISAEIAENPRSAEFARAVGEMKAELLDRRKSYRPN